jgi:hypothetical protein
MLTPLLSIGTGTSSKSQHFNKKTRPSKIFLKMEGQYDTPLVDFFPNSSFKSIGRLSEVCESTPDH